MANKIDPVYNHHRDRMNGYHSYLRKRCQASRLQWVIRAPIRLLGIGWFRFQISGELPSVPAVIVINHTSILDPLPVERAGPWGGKRPVIMAKAPLFKNPLLGWICNRLGFFPVQRGRSDQEAMQTALQVLRGGGRMVMFPEGTWNGGGEIGPFRSGAARIALEAQVPLIPVYLGNAQTDRGMWLPKRKRFQVVFGQPVWGDPCLENPVEDLTQRARDSLLKLQAL